jgi:hypothetical protein
MSGFITTRDLILHPYAIVSAFGIRVYARCVRRTATVLVFGRPTAEGRPACATFLECI